MKLDTFFGTNEILKSGTYFVIKGVQRMCDNRKNTEMIKNKVLINTFNLLPGINNFVRSDLLQCHRD